MMKFDDTNELAEILDELVCEEEYIVHIVGKHEFIKELFNHLIIFNEYEADSVIMPSPYDTNYDKELMITLYGNDTLDVSTVYDEDGNCHICDGDCCITYAHEDCNNKLLKNNDVVVFGIGKDECDISISDDGHTISQSYVSEDGRSRYFKSFYSDDIDLVKSMLDAWK